MKAYQIFMYLILFNLSVSLLTAIGVSPISVSSETTDTFFFGETSDYVFIFFITAMGIAALATYVKGSDKSLHTVIYGSFGGSVWWTFDRARVILEALGQEMPFPVYVLNIFGAIVVIVFIVGFAQMATGGWKSYD